jgi:hypothetical protein
LILFQMTNFIGHFYVDVFKEPKQADSMDHTRVYFLPHKVFLF